jgi:serine/threonine protein kinase
MSEFTVKQALKRVGSVLRRKWTVDKLIGLGGMASVYAATHRNGKRVAIKVLHPTLAMNADACERFLREGYAANQVDHPNAVSVLDDDETDDGAAFLVMELLEGEGLDARLERQTKLDPTEVLFIAEQVLDVLAAAHAKGIIHRDIKPANLFLSKDGSVKVLDFGLARMKESRFGGKVTRDGIVIGTASYMSPEQAQAKRDLIDARSDLWSVGATMFHALTGRYVHHGGTTMDRLIAAMKKPAPSIGSVAPELPESLVRLIDKSLAFCRENRWPDARSMQTALREVFAQITGQKIPVVERVSLSQVAGWVPPPTSAPAHSESLSVSVVFDPEGGDEYDVSIEYLDDGSGAGRMETVQPRDADRDTLVEEIAPTLSSSALEQLPAEDGEPDRSSAKRRPQGS